MRAHLQRAGLNLTYSLKAFYIRFSSPSMVFQQDLAACHCIWREEKKKNSLFLTNFTCEHEIFNKTKHSVLCLTLCPPQQVPLANGTTNTCSLSKCEVKLELAFEYLMSKDRLQWVTITSQQVRRLRQGSEISGTFQILLVSGLISGYHDEHLPSVNGGRADGEEIRWQH